MFPKTLFTISTLLLLLPSTSLASPIQKRDPGNSHEILYLCDCDAPNNLTSQLTYYLDWKNSLNGERAVGKAPLPSRVKWENATHEMGLRPEIQDFQTVAINPYTEDAPYRSFAGVMNTTNGLYLPCFKDNGNFIYTDDGGAKCYSKYFCVDAATFSQFNTCFMPAFDVLSDQVPRPLDFFFRMFRR